METVQKILLVITIIGAINWGLIGLLNFNLVETIFNNYEMYYRENLNNAFIDIDLLIQKNKIVF